MKKLLTILSLMSILTLSAFAQDGQPADKCFKPGFGPGFGNNDCPENGMGPMHGGKGFKRDKGMWGDDNRGGHFGPMMMEQLDLNDDQMEKIKKIKIKYDKMEIDLKAELKKLRIDKREAMQEMNFDKAKDFTKKMADVRTKDQISNIDQMSEMTKVLSKEQLEKLKDLHKGPGMMKHKMMKKDK